MEIKDKLILGSIVAVICLVAFTAGLTGRAVMVSCTDSDRGDLNMNEIYEQGTIAGISNNNMEFDRTDYCVNSGYLKEYGCNREKPTRYESRLVICENGCFDGACNK